MRRASKETAPWVQFISTSPKRAVSPNVPALLRSPALRAQDCASELSLERDPIITSCPSATNLLANVRPTTPVPITPNFILTPGIFQYPSRDAVAEDLVARLTHPPPCFFVSADCKGLSI